MTERNDTHADETTLDRLRTGELPAGERARLAAHVERCGECARALAELEALADLMGRAYAADRAATGVSDPGWERLRARVTDAVRAAPAPAAAEPPRAAPSGERRPARAWNRWIPQAAAAVVALLVLGVLFREGMRSPEDAARLAEPGSGVRVSAPRIPLREPAPPATEALTADEGRERDLAADRPMEMDAERAGGRAADVRENEEALAAARQEAFRDDAPPPAAVPPDAVPRNGAFGRRADAQERAPAPAVAETAPDPYDRFTIQARAAMATRDTAAARRTLALWRDTLAPRFALEEARRREVTILADSLAALLTD